MKFTLPERKKLVFTMTVPIRWGDMDAMNHSITVGTRVGRSSFLLERS